MCKRGKMSQRPPKEEISPIPPIACVWMDDMAYAALEMDLTLGGISSCICFDEGFKIRNKTLNKTERMFLEYFIPEETDHKLKRHQSKVKRHEFSVFAFVLVLIWLSSTNNFGATRARTKGTCSGAVNVPSDTFPRNIRLLPLFARGLMSGYRW